jgi:hypothetical protein
MGNYWGAPNHILGRNGRIWSNLIPTTTTMERLPIELVTQILSYIPKEELKVIGFISPVGGGEGGDR